MMWDLKAAIYCRNKWAVIVLFDELVDLKLIAARPAKELDS